MKPEHYGQSLFEMPSIFFPEIPPVPTVAVSWDPGTFEPFRPAPLPATSRLVENGDPEPQDVKAPSHTRDVFDVQTFPDLVDWVVALTRQYRYEALAACGHSGLLVAAAAGYVLRIPVIAVRKADDRAKGDSAKVNAVLPHRALAYAIVDDFVSSGQTCWWIASQIKQTLPTLQLRGVLLYGHRYSDAGSRLRSYAGVDDTLFPYVPFYARHEPEESL